MEDAVTRAVNILNEALDSDPEALTRLVNMRAECNDSLASHPLIEVGIYGGVHRIGVLGLLNAALGDSPSGVVGARGPIHPDTGQFVRIKEFVDLRLERTDLLT
ncbi:MAG: hypothetical protein ISR47_05145 [Rhodospirillales bacterium]|nr:hypothetical protein [Rhodospirillales bacterium]